MATGTASDYAALIKEYQTKQAGVKKWEELFLQPYQTAAEQVQTQTQYDISGAFANYKRAQLNTMQATQLGSGFKEQIASDLKSQYSSAYSQLRQEEAGALGEIQTSYLKTLAQQEENLMKQGEKFAALENKMFDFAGITQKQAESAYGAELGDEGTGLGYFEPAGDGTYNITERGMNFYDRLLNLGLSTGEKDSEGNEIYKSFRDYLLEQEETELFDFYTQNYDVIKQLTGGLKSGDVSYSKQDVMTKDILDWSSEYKDYIKATEFESIEKKHEYLSSVKNTIDDINSISNRPDATTSKTSENTSKIDTALNKILSNPKYTIAGNSAENNYTIDISMESLTDEEINQLEQNGFKSWTKYNLHKKDEHYLRFRGNPSNLKITLLNMLKQK